MNTNYESQADENEAATVKMAEARNAVACELMEAIQLPVVLMVSQNGDWGCAAYVDVSREDREEVYTRLARYLDIEIDEDENFYSEVNETIATMIDNEIGE